MSNYYLLLNNEKGNNNGDEDDDDDSCYGNKFNIDTLFEKKKQRDLNTLKIFEHMLATLYKKLKYTTNNKNYKLLYYIHTVPSFCWGTTNYDVGECIAFIMDKLIQSNFVVKFVPANKILISWDHWVPSYVRQQIKNKMGIDIDERGRDVTHLKKINDNKNNNNVSVNNRNNLTYDPNDILSNNNNEKIHSSTIKQLPQLAPAHLLTPKTIKHHSKINSSIYNDDDLNKLSHTLT